MAQGETQPAVRMSGSSDGKALEVAGGLVDIEQIKKDLSSFNYEFSSYAGRRYASTELGHYFMPNDVPEVHRLNEQHWVLTATKGGKLHSAPISTETGGLKILDIGCGSGIWCVQMAEDYPEAMMIVGMDISPIQPKTKPANVEWIVHDMEKDWPYPEEYFDFIHLSLVHGCVADWDAMMKKIMRHLASGGYVEHQEYSLCRLYQLSPSNDEILRYPENVDISTLAPIFRWGRLMEQAGIRRGRPLQLGPKLVSFQTNAGLEHVTEAIYPMDVGTWSADPKLRQIGARNLLQVLQGMEGFTTVMFTKVLGWSLEDTNSFLQDAKRDLRDDSLRKIIDLHVVYGKKPNRRKDNVARRYVDSPEEAWKYPFSSWSVQFASGVLVGGLAFGMLTMIMRRKR